MKGRGKAGRGRPWDMWSNKRRKKLKGLFESIGDLRGS